MAIPVFDIGRIFEWFGNITKTALVFMATKVAVALIIMTFVPLAIYKGLCLMMQYIASASSGLAGSGGLWSGQVIEYTGLGAWLATQLKLPECASLYLGSLVVVFALSFLRR